MMEEASSTDLRRTVQSDSRQDSLQFAANSKICFFFNVRSMTLQETSIEDGSTTLQSLIPIQGIYFSPLSIGIFGSFPILLWRNPEIHRQRAYYLDPMKTRDGVTFFRSSEGMRRRSILEVQMDLHDQERLITTLRQASRSFSGERVLSLDEFQSPAISKSKTVGCV